MKANKFSKKFKILPHKVPENIHTQPQRELQIPQGWGINDPGDCGGQGN